MSITLISCTVLQLYVASLLAMHVPVREWGMSEIMDKNSYCITVSMMFLCLVGHD